MRAKTSLSLIFFFGLLSAPAQAFPNLDIPYFNQYRNTYEPAATCGITSGAMVMNSFSKGHTTPDRLYLRYGKNQGQTPEGLAQIFRNEGFFSKSSRTGTRAELKRHLDSGRPVVIHGWFTGSGHIIALRGYDQQGFIVNDPAGLWHGCYQCGHSSDSGENLVYSYSEMSNAVISVDGDIWYSTLDVKPF